MCFLSYRIELKFIPLAQAHRPAPSFWTENTAVHFRRSQERPLPYQHSSFPSTCLWFLSPTPLQLCSCAPSILSPLNDWLLSFPSALMHNWVFHSPHPLAAAQPPVLSLLHSAHAWICCSPHSPDTAPTVSGMQPPGRCSLFCQSRQLHLTPITSLLVKLYSSGLGHGMLIFLCLSEHPLLDPALHSISIQVSQSHRSPPQSFYPWSGLFLCFIAAIISVFNYMIYAYLFTYCLSSPLKANKLDIRLLEKIRNP